MDISGPPRSLAATRVVAALFAGVGPCGAWLYESGRIDVFADAALLNLWVVVALAVAGIGVGVYAVIRGARLFGAATLILNSGVAALYGFLGVFFGLGGAR